MALHPLTGEVYELLQKYCVEQPNEVSHLLHAALHELSTDVRNRFIQNLSNSHPKAQKRLFDKMTELRAEQLRSLAENIANLHPDGSSNTVLSSYQLNEFISLKVSDQIDTTWTEVGREHIQNAVLAVENELNIRILERQPNPHSIKFLEMGYPSKPMRIKAKTADTGLVAGLIPIDQSLSKVALQAGRPEIEKLNQEIQNGILSNTLTVLPLERDGFWGIHSEDTVQVWKLREYVAPTDSLIGVVGDFQTGKPFTADLDVALITQGVLPFLESQKGFERIYFDSTFGIESEFERNVRFKINAYYQAYTLEGSLSHARDLNTLVNHGPETRNPCHRPPDYPFMDSQGHEILPGPPDDPHLFFRKFLEQLKDQGQYFEIPAHWDEELYECKHTFHWPPIFPTIFFVVPNANGKF